MKGVLLQVAVIGIDRSHRHVEDFGDLLALGDAPWGCRGIVVPRQRVLFAARIAADSTSLIVGWAWIMS